MKIRIIKALIGFLLGYEIAIVLWVPVFLINQMVFPNQYTETWRFIVWMIGIGTLNGIPLSLLFAGRKKRGFEKTK